ncbi:50S ribosomal protein L12 [Corynebacterium sp.]|uniref:50S ribosomal protein L12 n=1 Tax=Corynebacterium sp. TaxID=1720 RepID=UPI0026DFBCFC|nr:50S ribosomal protein L12 [Corynebacterium sp.]MDO5511105.1 50S ribosomal protein L12 [Corynebacterium sp.]
MFGNSAQQARIDELTRRVASLEKTVAALCQQAGLPEPPAMGVVASAAVRALVAEGKPIMAIKKLREETGLGLREAKLIVDEIQRA